MRCLVARFEDQEVRFPLPDHEASIGSSSSNEICLPYPGVSRVHARARMVDGLLHIRDAGSKNRLILGEDRVDEVRLREDLEVQIGRVFLSVENASTSDNVIALRSPRHERSHTTAGNTAPVQQGRNDSAGTPAAAVRCIREMERAGAARLRRERGTFLSRVSETLGATSVVLLNVGPDGETAVVAAGGPLPEGALLDGVAAAATSSDVTRSEIIHGKLVRLAAVRRRERGSVLAAVFDDLDHRLEQWEADFFDYVARKFLDDDTASRTDSANLTTVLQLPDGMILGESPAMRGLVRQLQATVRSQIDVLLWGETGTGKELFAQLIHRSGSTPSGPFVAINCAAIPSELLEAELFGVRSRVATGVDPRPGLFQEADGGTIFLDEIGELAPALQAKLLRVLQEREILPIGATKPVGIDVRVVSSSNQDLLAASAKGAFRADLYYRLRGLQFHIPPLRERREDIPPLVLAFVDRFAGKHGKHVQGVSRKALRTLMAHAWPGNVRELQNEVERAVLVCPKRGVLCEDHFATVKYLVDHEAQATSGETPATTTPVPVLSPLPISSDTEFPSLSTRLESVEREAILDALRITRGNKTKAAKLLGITRNGLAGKMVRFGIE